MPFDFNILIIESPSSTEIENVRMDVVGTAHLTLSCLHELAKTSHLRRYFTLGLFLKWTPLGAVLKYTLRQALVDPMVVPRSQVEQGPNMKRMICVSGTVLGQQLSNGLRF